MDGLTPEDIKRLEAPLPLEFHEARAKGLNKKKDKQQWLVYINQEGVIPLLNSIDPNWSWDVQNVHYEQRYVAVTGRLTIKGVGRDGTGGNSPNGANSPVDEDTVKGAETDALKRAALRFGVGLYLRSTPTFWINYDESRPWEGEDEAQRKFREWYISEFKTAQRPNATPPPNGNSKGASAKPAAPTNTGAAQDGSSAGAEFFPSQPADLLAGDEDGTPISPVKHYTCSAIRVVKFGTGKQIHLKRKGSQDWIALMGREKLIKAGYPEADVNGWIDKLVSWTPLVPEADVEAAFDGTAWDVGEIRLAELAVAR